MSPRKPVLFELGDDAPPVDPASAAPPPEDEAAPQGRAMRVGAGAMAGPGSRIARVVLSALGAFVALTLSVAAWDFAAALMQRAPALGLLAWALMGLAAFGLVVVGVREWMGFRRLRRIDGLREKALAARANADLLAARDVAGAVAALYAMRAELRWARGRLDSSLGDAFDADAVLMLAENTMLAPLDSAACAEVEAAARQVALVTAVVPMAFLDVAVALLTNLRMIRRIAALYGGRTGTLGSLRLLRAVFAHLLATGLVSAGEDLIGSVAGGGLLSKLSRRVGEGVMNGALTARVGVAAIEVCRPLPFCAAARPRVAALVQRALTGLFDRNARGDGRGDVA